MVLIVVFTPLQFLNALEYIKNIDEEYDIVVLTETVENLDGIYNIDKENKSIYPFRKFSKLESNLVWFIKFIYALFLLPINKYDKLILGNINNVVGYLLASKYNKKNKEIVLLDDGVATLSLYIDRNKNANLYVSYLFGGKFIKIYKMILKSFSSSRIQKVEFFTIYNLVKLFEPKYDKVTNFKYSSIQDDKIIDKNQVWFIGQPLIHKDYLSEKEFNYHIDKVVQYCKNENKEFQYILHRREEFRDVPYNTIKYDRPLESVFEDLENIPGTVITFISSAIINLSSIYKEIDYRYIHIPSLSEVNKESINRIYRYFEISDNIKKINFDY